MRYIGGLATDIGSTRKVNQDAVILKKAAFDENGALDLSSDEVRFALLAVCDGIGGLKYGEISSGIVRKGIDEWCDSVLKWMDIRTVDSEMVFSHLKDAADEWNCRVIDFARDCNAPTGTTMSLLMLIKDGYFILQVGDSRIYRIREGVAEQLTIDASVVRYRDGKPKSYLNNFMGRDDELKFTFSSGDLSAGDTFLVCSDGFYHRLKPEDILVFDKAGNDQDIKLACKDLVAMMLERGETDNISIGALKIL